VFEKKVCASVDSSSARSVRSKILADLRSLRESLAHARDSLMHFKDDRVDRDRLEPAARRVDDLINMFAGTQRDAIQGSLWVTEIQSGIEEVTNPKAADALNAARIEAAALLEAMAPTSKAN
jgi:hypothetical protein